MGDDFSKIYDKILVKQLDENKIVAESSNEKIIQSENIIEENEPLVNFLSKLQNTLKEKVEEKVEENEHLVNFLSKLQNTLKEKVEEKVEENEPLVNFLSKLQNNLKEKVEEKVEENEPLVNFLSKLQNTLKEKVEEKVEENEPLVNFLSKLQNTLKENTKKDQKNNNGNFIFNKNVKRKILNDSEKNQNDYYIDELIKTDRNTEKKLVKENEDLSNQIQSLKTQITRLNVEGGTWGGGDIGGGGSIVATGCCCAAESCSDVSGLSANWESTYTTFRDVSSTFLTSETDSQTLSFDETTKDLSISNGNTVSLSALLDDTGIDTGVRSLTSNWESTYTTVSSNSAAWSTLYTIVQNNSSTWVNVISAQVMYARVYNADSVTMNKGDVVYTFGSTGDTMSVKLASNTSEATSSKTLGFVNETIVTGGIGYVVIAGQIDKMNLPHQTFSEGDALWLGSTPGTFTRIKPTAPNHGVYLGVVERANGGNGLAYVKVQNGYELNEIHDVLISSVSAGDIIRRNNANNLWTNTNDGAKWDSVYTTVNSNSGAGWGSNISSLSGNWQNTYTNYSDSSSSYIRTYTSDSTPVYFIRMITQEDYNAISTINQNTLYIISN